MTTGAVSHAATWFIVGSITVGLLLIWALMSAHRSHPLAERLNARSMFSLTITTIFAIFAIFEVECLTESCDHTLRHLYNIFGHIDHQTILGHAIENTSEQVQNPSSVTHLLFTELYPSQD